MIRHLVWQWFRYRGPKWSARTLARWTGHDLQIAGLRKAWTFSSGLVQAPRLCCGIQFSHEPSLNCFRFTKHYRHKALDGIGSNSGLIGLGCYENVRVGCIDSVESIVGQVIAQRASRRANVSKVCTGKRTVFLRGCASSLTPPIP